MGSIGGGRAPSGRLEGILGGLKKLPGVLCDHRLFLMHDKESSQSLFVDNGTRVIVLARRAVPMGRGSIAVNALLSDAVGVA